MNGLRSTNSLAPPGSDEVLLVHEEPPSLANMLLQWLAVRSRLLARHLDHRARRRSALLCEIRSHTRAWQNAYIRLVQFNVLFGKEVVVPIDEEEREQLMQAVSDTRRLGGAIGGKTGRAVRDLGLAIESELHSSERHMRRVQRQRNAIRR